MTDTAETTEKAPPQEKPTKKPWWLRRYTFTGTAVGLVFLWLSLTPSLLPRGPLFQGLVSAAAGAIVIDQQNIAAVSLHSLRSQIAYVGQDVFLFHASVRENIAIGRPGASEAEIVAAAKAANAHDFIVDFAKGYDTPVGEHGLKLSGGERQRIAIARALLKDAPIILMDEATASLDSESEREVQRAIEHLCQGRTTIAIAHRLSTIRDADIILVMEHGQIVEQGNHEGLLASGGAYAQLYQAQFAAPAVDIDGEDGAEPAGAPGSPVLGRS